jgi:vitamin B12 transporter
VKKTVLSLAIAGLALPYAQFSAAQSSNTQTTLEQVNVTSSRSVRPTLDTLADVTVIDRSAIANGRYTGLLDLLQAQAGIEVTQQGSLGGVFVRGTKTAQTLILIDGIRLENPLSGGANFEFIPLSVIDRVEISRGPASSFYGSAAMGGVIQIFTRQEPAGSGVTPFGSFSVGTQGTVNYSAGVSGSDGTNRWLLSAARDKTEGYENTRPGSSSYQADKDANRQTSVTGSFSSRLSPSVELGVSGFYTTGRSYFDSQYSLPAETRLDFSTRSLSGFLKTKLTNEWASEFRLGQSGIFYDYYDASGFSPFAPTSKTLNFAWTNRYSLGQQESAGALLFGIERSRQTVTGPGVSTGASVYAETARQINSFFGGYEARADAHSLRLQGRYDSIGSQLTGVKNSAKTGTLAYGYRISNGWQARASAGSAFRAPTFDDLYNPFGANPNLQPEKSLGYEIGIERRLNGSVFKVTGFSQKIKQAIELDSFFIAQNYEAAKVRGATMEARYQAGQFNLRGQVTAQHTEGTYTDFSTSATVSGRLARRANTHGTIGVQWSQMATATSPISGPGNGFSAGADLQFQGNRIDTNGARMGGYSVMNLNANYRFGQSWVAFAKLGNVFDRSYELASGYNPLPRQFMLGFRYN